MDKKTGELLLQAIERMEGSLQTMKAIVQQEMGQKPSITQSPTKSSVNQSHVGTKKARGHIADSLPADLLGPVPNYNDENWPAATSPYMIVKSDMEKQFRAVQIVGLMSIPFEDMSVLDVGCGEGHIPREIANRAKQVKGYDIRSSKSWAALEESAPSGILNFVTDKELVESGKPYDCITLYDVLDHIEKEDPIKFLRWLGSLLAPEGRIFIRTHPWTSKHGSHLYENGLNKAYLHLALTPDEMIQAGIELKPNLRIARPMAAYESMFRDSGLRVFDRKGINEPVEPFFTGPLLDRIIKVTWRGAIEPDAAIKIMTNSFIDYHLNKL